MITCMATYIETNTNRHSGGNERYEPVPGAKDGTRMDETTIKTVGVIIISRDLKSLPVIQKRSRLYNDGKKKENKSEKNNTLRRRQH